MKYLITLPLIILHCALAMAQGVCTGNLGENIFISGDFGSGAAPVVLSNPNIAPGYTYTTQVPFDGAYTICSRTSALVGLYPSWIQIEDNSPDPNGYMMVVNGSYEPGIFYEEVVDGLCENTNYEFSADIINLVSVETTDHIEPNVTFLIDDLVVYETGNIPQTEQWVKFGFSFTTTNIQSSIKLSLRNNAPGGAGNDLALDNISFRPCGPTSFIGLDDESSNIFLCVDDDPLTVVADIESEDGASFAILWQTSTDSMNWETIMDNNTSTITHTQFDVGVYYYRYLSSGNIMNIENEKCRIISDILKITVLPDTYPQIDTVCIGEQYQFGNQILESSGIYMESFESSRGCDSTIILDLLFVPENEIIIDAMVSDPSCYEFSDGSISVTQLSGGYGGLSSELLDNQGSPVTNDLSAGQYTIIASDRFSCTEELVITLNQPEEISVDIGPDASVLLGQELLIAPSYSQEFDNISWSSNGEFDCDDCLEVNLLQFNNGYVNVTVSDENNCVASDSLFLTVDEQNLINIPNIFSPNEDGVNDFMTINYFGRSLSSIIQFSVYDRWGNQMYNIENTTVESGQNLWDGYATNRPVSNGVYLYYLKARYINGTVEEISKSITVLK